MSKKRLFAKNSETATRLLKIVKSSRNDKKLMAVFTDGVSQRVTHFGAHGMSDFTIHHDVKRRNSYRSRHAKDLDTGDPTRAGFLSWYILWGDSISLQKNIAAYRKKFGL